jgi:hypothetical protein
MLTLDQATIKSMDGQTIIETTGGHVEDNESGWMLLKGRPEEFPELQPYQNYYLELNDGRRAEIRLREKRHTLMLTSHHTELHFSTKR